MPGAKLSGLRGMIKPAQSYAEHDQFDDSEDHFVDYVKKVLG